MEFRVQLLGLGLSCLSKRGFLKPGLSAQGIYSDKTDLSKISQTAMHGDYVET